MLRFRSRSPWIATPSILLVCAGAGLLLGQTSAGRISGSVTDPSGAPVAGTAITILDTDTQEARTVAADAAGFYVATNLPIGHYRVEADQKGFKREVRNDLELFADSRLTVDFALQIGAVTETVEVVAGQTEQINTVSGELARVIDSKDVANLALNGRNYIQLLTLVPGTVVTTIDSFGTTTSLASNTQSVNGNRVDSNNLTVDGAYNQVAGSNGSLINNVGVDFVQEVKIQTSNYSAEYGRKSGAAFNIVTKNGTNDFHGAAFEYLRNDAVDARNFFAPSKSELRFNDFGGDAGGPIRKNKFFFFAGMEWKRLRQNQDAKRVTLPSTAQLNGDFSSSKTAIYQPGTTIPFPGNQIFKSLLTPDGQAIANVYRYMQQTLAGFTDQAVTNNAVTAPASPLNFREALIRLDYKINDNHMIYGRWIQDANDLIDPFGTFSSSNLPVIESNRLRPGESFLVAETWVVNPHLVNEVRASVGWSSQNIPPYGTSWQRSNYGFQYPQLFPNGGPYESGIPSVSISNISNFKGPGFSLHSPGTDIQFNDTVSLIRGDHTFKAGFVLIRGRNDQNGRTDYTGNLTFATTGNTHTSGNALADAMMGNFATYQESASDPLGFFRYTEPEAFVQDSWRVNRKLSLELGVRYQSMQPWHLQANNAANFLPSLYNPATAVRITTTGTIVPGSGNPYDGLILAGSGVPADQQGRVPGSTGAAFSAVPVGAPRGFYNSENTFAPRVGFAYSVNDKTVVRGGYGIYFDRPQGNLIFSQLNVPPVTLSGIFQNGNLSNPSGGTPSTSTVLGTITSIDPNLKFSYNQQYSFNIQRTLPWGLFLESSYVGNLGRHLIREVNLNKPDFAALAANAALPTSQQVNTIYLNPYKGYSTINQFRSDSTSNYHALQVFLARRKGSLTFNTGYTFSKVLSDSSAYNDTTSGTDDPNNRHFNYGPATFDRRHQFVDTIVWAMPKLSHQNALIREAAGGWQLSAVVRMQSGPYLTPTANTAIGTRRAQYLGGPVLAADRGPNGWVNPAAFGPAPAGAYGNAGVGIIEAPGLRNYDLSLAKHFPIRERYDLRFQTDFFNAFNNVNLNTLGGVQTSAGFGTLTGAYPARNLQFGLRLGF